jgi:hypothetical protein
VPQYPHDHRYAATREQVMAELKTQWINEQPSPKTMTILFPSIGDSEANLCTKAPR